MTDTIIEAFEALNISSPIDDILNYTNRIENIKLLKRRDIIQWLYGDLSFLSNNKKDDEDKWGYELMSKIKKTSNKQWTTNMGQMIGLELLLLRDGSSNVPNKIKNYQPDAETPKIICEIKSRTYTTSGTAGEKILGVPLKYAELPTLYKKPVEILCIGYQEKEAKEKFGILKTSKNIISERTKILEFFKECKFSYIGATEILNDLVKNIQDDLLKVIEEHKYYTNIIEKSKNDITEFKNAIVSFRDFAKEKVKSKNEKIITYIKDKVFKELKYHIDEYKKLQDTNKNTDEKSTVDEKTIVDEKIVLKTEDTGKTFEKAICLLYDIEYDGNFKYSVDEANKMKEMLRPLKDIFPMCKHTANKNGRYDFTAIEDNTRHLSAKTTKYSGKIAPPIIGQSQPSQFCKILGIEYTNCDELKKYIQENIVKILPIIYEYTLDCATIYYNKNEEKIRYIETEKNIDWTNYIYSWTKRWDEWNNSSTMKIEIDNKKYSLMEFQFHSTSRTNMAIRWDFENLLTLFKDYLLIIDFQDE
jgi:hypothetical protein